MIKVNLLPKSINERKVIRNIAILFGIGVVAILVAGFMLNMKLKADVEAMEAKAENAKQWKEAVTKVNDQTNALTAAAGPIKAKLDFINAILDYNQKYPKLYEEIAKWTYEKVAYDSMQCTDGATVQIQARVKSLDDLGRYLLNMYRAGNLFQSVSISGIPGYPQDSTGQGGPSPYAGIPSGPTFTPSPGGPRSEMAGLGAIAEGVTRAPVRDNWIHFTVTCVLKDDHKIVQPTPPGQAPAGGAPAAPGAPATPGGPPSMMPDVPPGGGRPMPGPPIS